MTDVESEERDEGGGDTVIDPRIQVLADDLPGTARRLYDAITALVERDYDAVELEERDGVMGARWTGSVNAVIRGLWPVAASGSADVVPGAIAFRRNLSHHLAASQNVVALGRASKGNAGLWWVRAAWNDAPVPARSNPSLVERVAVMPDEVKLRRRGQILNRLVPWVQANPQPAYTLAELTRGGKTSVTTITGLFGGVVGLRAALDEELPYECRFASCHRRFTRRIHLGRHEQNCPNRPVEEPPAEDSAPIEVVGETRDEEIDIMGNQQTTLRQQVNELKRLYAALFAFATLNGTPIPKSAGGDLSVSGYSPQIRSAALEELLRSRIIRLDRVGGKGEGRGFEVYVATDPRASLKGSAVDHPDSVTITAPVDGGPVDYHAVLGGLLTELDALRERDRKTAALREALRGLD